MRAAILADIHGNSAALDAVLADIEEHGGCDAYWALGDLCAIGYDPVGVLNRLNALPDAIFIRGNTDRFVTTNARPPAPTDSIETRRMLDAFAWTTRAVTEAGWFSWLESLPLDWRTELPDGTRVLAVHASPGTDEGRGFVPDQIDEEMAVLLDGSDADLVVVGHTHQQVDRTLSGVRVFNPASVSIPFTTDLRAKYGVLDVDTSGYVLAHRCVDYDREAAVAEMRAAGYPSADYVAARLLGTVGE